MVFQNYALFPHMTVAENLAFPLVEVADSLIRRPSAVTLIEARSMTSRPSS